MSARHAESFMECNGSTEGAWTSLWNLKHDLSRAGADQVPICAIVQSIFRPAVFIGNLPCRHELSSISPHVKITMTIFSHRDIEILRAGGGCSF